MLRIVHKCIHRLVKAVIDTIHQLSLIQDVHNSLDGVGIGVGVGVGMVAHHSSVFSVTRVKWQVCTSKILWQLA